VAYAGHSGKSVELHVRVEHSARLRVHDLLFVKRPANTHYHGAVDLALGRFEVDDQAAILHRNDLVDAHYASLHVHRDIGHLDSTDALVGQTARTWVLPSDGERRRPKLG